MKIKLCIVVIFCVLCVSLILTKSNFSFAQNNTLPTQSTSLHETQVPQIQMVLQPQQATQPNIYTPASQPLMSPAPQIPQSSTPSRSYSAANQTVTVSAASPVVSPADCQAAPPVYAPTPYPVSPPVSPDKLREIFVPATELGSLFDAAKDRLLIKRSEFDQLRKKARETKLALNNITNTTKLPAEAILLSSDYKITIADLRVLIEGELEIELLTDDLVALPLQFDHVSLIEAKVAETNKPAALRVIDAPVTSVQSAPIQMPTQQPIQQPNANRTNQSQFAGNNSPAFDDAYAPRTMLLILQGKKRHKIKLTVTTPLQIDSTRQHIAYLLPHGTKVSTELTIPGDVELKSGAAVLSRKVSEVKDKKNSPPINTHFDLLIPAGDQITEIIMSLNSHRSSTYQAVLARSVQFAEITEQYERLHATVSLTEMHQGISETIFEIPPQFEITDVNSVLLDKWNVEKADDKNGLKHDNLKIKFREQVPGLTTIYLSAIKIRPLANNNNDDWKFPLFVPSNVAANSAVLGLLVEQEIEMTDLTNEKLYPIDSLILKDAIPPSVLNAVPGSPLIRLAAAWYAPRENYSIKAKFKRPKNDCNIETEEVLTIADKSPTININFELTPRAGKIFETFIEFPKIWKINEIKNVADDKPLIFHNVISDNTILDKTNTDESKVDNSVEKNISKDTQRIRVQFPYGIIPGEVFSFDLTATGEIEGWFHPTDEKKIDFPIFNIDGVTSSQGSILVQYDGEEDWEIIPLADENLIPFEESIRTKKINNTQANTQISIPEKRNELTYEYVTKPFKLAIKLEKLQPRLNARTLSVYKFNPTLLSVDHFIRYTVNHASTQRLSFLLPINTPATPSIKSADNFSIKETFSKETIIDNKKFRRWEIVLTKPQSGSLKLYVNFEMPIEFDKNNKQTKWHNLPEIITENTAWQSEFIAIEGDEELDLTIPDESQNSQNLSANQTTNNTTNQSTDKIANPTTSNNNDESKRVRAVLRPIDIGMISDMDYRAGKRLVGAYSLVNDAGEVIVGVRKNEMLQLVTAVVNKVTATALIGDQTQSGTLYAITYNLRTNGTSVKLTLGENDVLWTVFLNNKPIKPQRVNNDILIPIQQQTTTQPANSKTTNSASSEYKISFVYHKKNNPIKSTKLSFPSLRIQNADKETNIPVMQTEWYVSPPSGYQITKLGDVDLEQNKTQPLLLQIFQNGLEVAGGILSYKTSDIFPFLNRQQVRESGRRYYDRENSPRSDRSNAEPELMGGGYNGGAKGGVLNHLSDDELRRIRDSGLYNSRVLLENNMMMADAVGVDNDDNDIDDNESLTEDGKTSLGKKDDVSGTSDNRRVGRGRASGSGNAVGIAIKEPKSPPMRGTQKAISSIRRLQSVQPVTVVVGAYPHAFSRHDFIGTKGVQEISFRLLNRSRLVVVGWLGFFVVLFFGLLIFNRGWRVKLWFVVGILAVGTLLIFLPGLEFYGSVVNSAVCAAIIAAGFFIIAALINTINKKLKQPKQLDNKAV